MRFNELVRKLVKGGWRLKRTGKSSLRIFERDGVELIVHYHGNAEVPKGTADAILKKAGLDVPQVTELVFKLRKQGIDIDPDVLTEEECVNALASVLKEGKT